MRKREVGQRDAEDSEDEEDDNKAHVVKLGLKWYYLDGTDADEALILHADERKGHACKYPARRP